MILKFGDTDPFPEISDDWDIVSINNSKVELSDADNEGDTELLTFTKI